MNLNDKIRHLRVAGFESQPNKLVMVRGSVEVSLEEIEKNDMPYLAHMIEVRGRKRVFGAQDA